MYIFIYVIFLIIPFEIIVDSCAYVRNNIETLCNLYPISFDSNILQNYSMILKPGYWQLCCQDTEHFQDQEDPSYCPFWSTLMSLYHFLNSYDH